MKKRILLTLLALTLIVSAVATTAFADTITLDTDPLVIWDGESATPTTPYVSDVKGAAMTIYGLDDIAGIQYKLGESGSVTTVEASSFTDGAFTISGLVEGETYYVAVWHKAITPIQSGDGNLYIYNYSTFVPVELVSLIDNGAKWDKPEGLSIVNDKLAGNIAGISYEFVKIDTLADTLIDDTAYAPVDVVNTTFADGLWAVRRAAGDDGVEKFGASDPVILLSRGADAGTFGLTGSSTIEQGKWTRLGEGTLKSAGANGDGPHSLVMQVNKADKAGFIDGSLYYPMADSEIIPAEDFFRFSFGVTEAVVGLIDDFSTEGFTVDGQAILHVIGGSVDSYTVDFSWNYGTSQVIDFTSIEGRDGYVYAIELDLFADSSENYSINEGDYTYQLVNFSGGMTDEATSTKINRIKYSSRGVHAVPVLTAEGSSVEGQYLIKGFDPTLGYMMSTDNMTFTPVESGVSQITVNATGRYFFYVASDANNSKSDPMSVYIKGSQPAITGLVLDEETLTVSGFDVSVSKIEWGRVTAQGYEWTEKRDNSDVVLDGAGVYAFRYMNDPVQNILSGAPQFIYVRGTNTGTIRYAPTKGTEYAEHTGGFLPGYWTTPKGGTYIDGKMTSGYAFTKENAQVMGFMYQFTNEEILPIAELNSFSLSFISAVNTNSWFPGPFDAVLRIYVAGANVDFYDVNVTMPYGTLTTFNVSDLWREQVALDPNFTPAGYVLGFRTFLFDPLKENTAELTVGATPNNYLQVTFSGVNGEVMTLDAKKSLDLNVVRTVPAVIGYNAGDFTDCGEIIGLDPYVTYQIAPATQNGDEFTITGEWTEGFTGVSAVPVSAGAWAVRVYANALDPKFVSTKPVFVVVQEADPESEKTSAKVPKVLLPEDVTYADVDYVFDIDQTRWINRLTIENILATTPDATIIFEADDYRFTLKASDIDLSLSNAHYFDMKVTFDGESEYDRMYDKMAALADEKELVCGIHFESTTGYFFETAVFEVNLGAELDGMEVDLRSFNERVNRLRSEETTIVEGGWATFSIFGADYVILSPEWAEANAE